MASAMVALDQACRSLWATVRKCHAAMKIAAITGPRTKPLMPKMPSAQAEISQDKQDDDDGANEPNDSVHDSIPFRR